MGKRTYSTVIDYRFSCILLLLCYSLFTPCSAQMLYYGMTTSGGTNSDGTIISFNPSTNTESVLWSFATVADGTNPYGNFVYDKNNGLFYGMTYATGHYNRGTIISFNPNTNKDSVVWSFGNGTDGKYPYGSLVYDVNNGLFYGMTSAGGTYGGGAIISFNPITGREYAVWNFGNGTDASAPWGNLVYNSGNGMFYGLTSTGGPHFGGAIIRFNPNTNQDSVVWGLGSGTDGKTPYGSLALDSNNGMFYGMSYSGGTNSKGTIFRFNPNTNKDSVVWNLGYGSDGSYPYGSLVYDKNNGLYYGMTGEGGSNNRGTIIKFNPVTNQDSVLQNLSGGTGEYPYGDFVYDKTNGLFYGMIEEGGSNGYGTIITLNPSTNVENVAWNFGSGTDGKSPQGNLIYDSSNGLFYGLIHSGGVYTTGAVISFNPTNNSENMVWSFGNALDGINPGKEDLVLDPYNGWFYAMIPNGGTYNKGAIIKFDPRTKAESAVWAFGNGQDGKSPYGNLIFDTQNGLFYGMTDNGGSHIDSGTIISFDPATNSENVVWNFGGGTDASNPEGTFVYNPVNKLYYGMTSSGGASNKGAIISFNPVNNQEKVVWSFSGRPDGSQPLGAFTYDTSRKVFYGMTETGGSAGYGCILKFNPATNAENVLYSFSGDDPYGDVVYDPVNKMYYEMTLYGGNYSSGSIQRFNPNTNKDTLLWSFLNYGPDGRNPYGSFVYDVNRGVFYGMTSVGGLSTGAIIKFNPNTNQDSVVWNFGNGTDGSFPVGDLVHLPTCNLGDSVVVTNITCNGLSDGKCIENLVGGTSPYTYTWNNGASTSAISNLTAGTYTATVTDNNGCMASASVTITQPAAITTIADYYGFTDSACMGVAYALANGGTSPYRYLWTNGGTDDTAKKLCEGHYCCVVTDRNGCKDSSCINTATGINNMSPATDRILVYPNPNNGIFTIQANNQQLLANSYIEIYNVLGEKVYSQSKTNNSQLTINLNNQPNGVYLYRIITETGDLIGEGKIAIEK